jgi:hypothetical protein
MASTSEPGPPVGGRRARQRNSSTELSEAARLERPTVLTRPSAAAVMFTPPDAVLHLVPRLHPLGELTALPLISQVSPIGQLYFVIP